MTTEMLQNQSCLPTSCPGQGGWLQLLSERGSSDPLLAQPQLAEHLANCPACQAEVADVRRFQTLLLRGKTPQLSAEQRQVTEARVRELAAAWSAPPRLSQRWVWGVAIAAAAAVVAIVGRPYVVEHAQQQELWQKQLVAATLPTADKPGPGIRSSAVEGSLEVANRDGTWHPMQPGQVVQAGMRLRAGATAARLLVPGRFELNLQAHAELDVLATTPSSAVSPGDAALRLRSGEVDCAVEKLNPPQRFIVMFGGYRASVVGTRFAVQHAMASAGLQVQVTEGAVRVDQAEDWWHGPSGDTVTTVHAGQRWRMDGGRLSLEPMALSLAQPQSGQPAGVPKAAQLSGSAPAGAAIGGEDSTAIPVGSMSIPGGAVGTTVRSRIPVGREAAVRDALGSDSAGSGETGDQAKENQPIHRKRNILIEVPPQVMGPEEGFAGPH